jgi:glucosamine--fructose-6-phosphate aminotransferase (isomerizing)
LKRRLIESGHVFGSETDTEVLTHLVEEGMDRGLNFQEAFRRMGRMVKGSQAISAVLEGDEAEICALRLGHAGGIVVAQADGQAIIGSDLPALLPLLQSESNMGQVAFLETGEMVAITRDQVEYQDLEGNHIDKQPRMVSLEEVLVDKAGYQHFMLKEIMEQPQAVASAMRERVNFDSRRVELLDFPLSAQEIADLDRVMLIGCGTSLHAAQVGRHLIERYSGLPAEAESASEFRYRDPYIGPRTLVVAISQSGETADTVAAMQLVKDKGGRLINICNAEGSQASRIAEGSLYMRAGIEVGVASTKTFVASLTILNLLSIFLGQTRGVLDTAKTQELVDGLAQLPRLMGDLLADSSAYQNLAKEYVATDYFLFLGRGMNSPIASEGSLKLKEISYVHAEAYPAGEMKHGPIALIDSAMATVALAPKDSLYEKVVNNVKEVMARDGRVLAILTEGDTQLAGEVDHALYIPEAPEHLIPLLTVVPLQMLAYHVALLLNRDVDQPRNLAKSVTVE